MAAVYESEGCCLRWPDASDFFRSGTMAPFSLESLQVMQVQELPASADQQEWACNSAVTAILDSLAAILSISKGGEHFRALVPESCGVCEKLLSCPHPLIKVDSPLLNGRNADGGRFAEAVPATFQHCSILRCTISSCAHSQMFPVCKSLSISASLLSYGMIAPVLQLKAAVLLDLLLGGNEQHSIGAKKERAELLKATSEELLGSLKAMRVSSDFQQKAAAERLAASFQRAR